MPTMTPANFALPADGQFQLVPLGEHRLRLHRKTDAALVNALETRGVTFPPGERVSVIQVVDPDAIAAMANAFAAEAATPNFPGLLVDEDHFSLSPDRSSAARGWISNTIARPDGLYGSIRLVDETDLVRGRFRFLSPVFDPADILPLGNNRIRPLRLAGVALTNRPNMQTIRPLSNREPQQEEVSTMDYRKTLQEVLQLKPDAGDDTIEPARLALVNRLAEADALIGQRDAAQAKHIEAEQRATALTNRVSELETALANAQRAELERLVNADLVAFAAVIADKEGVRKALLANRDFTLPILKGLAAKAQTPVEPLRKPADGTVPLSLANADAEGRVALANRIAAQTALVNSVMAEYRCSSRAAAVELAMTRKPDLFG